MKTYAIILAAGKGSRMNSTIPKVCHTLVDKPIIQWVLDSLEPLRISQTFMVVGHASDQVKHAVNSPNVTFVHQDQQQGTGHAVMQTDAHLNSPHHHHHTVVILAGDCPLIQAKTIQSLLQIHHQEQAAATILTTELKSPGEYGRIIRNNQGELMGIREYKDCTDLQKTITEINSGVYSFNIGKLFSALSQITTQNKQSEYYLTDVIHILKPYKIASHLTPNTHETFGVNTPEDLAKIESILA